MAHMDSERILIISHSYKPFLNPRAFRWSAIAEHWAHQGKDIDIITSWQPGLKRYELVNGVEIHRVGGSLTERFRTLLRPKQRATTSLSKENQKTNQLNIIRILFGWVIRAALFLNDKIWKNIYWPDYACFWIGPASAKAQELCAMEQYGTVISVSDPFSSHLAGKHIKSKHPEMKWLVDIGDPFCFRHDNPTNNHRLYRKLNYRKENQLLFLADSVSVTTKSTKERYLELFGNVDSKTKVIPPILSQLPVIQEGNRILPENKNVKLVYVGTLYRVIRNPEYLLKLFKSLLSLNKKVSAELHFFGGYDDCREIIAPFQSLFADRLVLHGLVEQSVVLKAMSEADILINIGNANPYQLPSKLVEYGALGKPIVNLHSIENDSSKEFLVGYPGLLNLNAGRNSNLEHQAQLLSNFIGRLPIIIDQSFVQNWQNKFSVEKIADEYSSLLYQINIPEPVVI